MSAVDPLQSYDYATIVQLCEALRLCTERMRHMQGCRLLGESRPLDYSAEIRSAYAALARAEGEE